MEFGISVHNPHASKGIFPKLVFNCSVSAKSDYEKEATLLWTTAKLSYNGYTIAEIEPIMSAESIGNGYLSSMRDLTFTFDREKIKAIEANRQDDLNIHVLFGFLYSYVSKDGSFKGFGTAAPQYPFKFSQREWNEILRKMGYYESWILEIARPNIEGMDTVMMHLNKAADCLTVNSYEDAMSNLRSAWNAFKPLLSEKWEVIAKMINEGSIGEEGRHSKSERIKDIKEKVLYFSQVGVHREFYRVTPEDAQLNYYQTVSLISYLSKFLKKAD